MKRIITSFAALAAVPCVIAGPAQARTMWPGTYIGCQNYHIYGGLEAPVPAAAPRTCVLITHNDYAAKIFPVTDTLSVLKMRWSNWGHNTAYGVGKTIVTAPTSRNDAALTIHVTAYDLIRNVDPGDCGVPAPSYYGKIAVRDGRRTEVLRDKPDFEC